MTAPDIATTKSGRRPPKPPYRYTGTEPPAALAHLRNERVWCVWDYRLVKGRWTKPPIGADEKGAPVSITDPRNWVTWDDAVAAVQRYGRAGIGLVLEAAGYSGIDLDACITDSGSYTAMAAAVLEKAETYGEVSPSGSGVHLLVQGRIGRTIKRDDLGIEIYDRGRYFTVTAYHIEDTPNEIRPAPETIAYLTRLDRETPRPGEAKPKNSDRATKTAGLNGYAKPAGDNFFDKVRSLALDHLDDWVTSLHPSAKKYPNGALRVSAADLGRHHLEEDLSYHRSGITEFGEEHGITAIDAVMRYGRAADAIEAAMWLCHQMRVEPAALGWQGSAGQCDRQGKQGEAEKPAAEEAPPHVPMVVRSAWDILKVSPAPRCWHLEHWMPGDDVTGLWSDGGIGKTTLEMQLAYCTATGMPFLGMPVRAGGAVVLTAEEHNDEMDFRIHQIADGIIVPDETIKHPFEVVSRAGEDALLARFTKSGGIEPTILWKELLDRIGDLKCAFVGIDPSADVFGGNEIDRAQVRAFVNMLRKPAIEHKCAVLLAGHASVDGLKTGRGYSGSTAWNNSVRARWYFERPRDENGKEDESSDLRELSLKKTNRGKPGQSMILNWRGGWFSTTGGGVRQGGPAMPEAKAKFMTLLAAATDQGRKLSDREKANNYAPAQFAKSPDGPPHSKWDYEKAMRELFSEGRIVMEPYGPPSRDWARMVAK